LELTTRHGLGSHNQTWAWRSQPDTGLELTTKQGLGGPNQTWAWRSQPDTGLELTTKQGLGGPNQTWAWRSQPNTGLELTTKQGLGGPNQTQAFRAAAPFLPLIFQWKSQHGEDEPGGINLCCAHGRCLFDRGGEPRKHHRQHEPPTEPSPSPRCLAPWG